MSTAPVKQERKLIVQDTVNNRNAFYDIAIDTKGVVTYRFGRIGASAAPKKKVFSSYSQAIAFYQEKIQEKLDKGYIDAVDDVKELDVKTITKAIKILKDMKKAVFSGDDDAIEETFKEYIKVVPTRKVVKGTLCVYNVFGDDEDEHDNIEENIAKEIKRLEKVKTILQTYGSDKDNLIKELARSVIEEFCSGDQMFTSYDVIFNMNLGIGDDDKQVEVIKDIIEEAIGNESYGELYESEDIEAAGGTTKLYRPIDANALDYHPLTLTTEQK